MWKMLIEHTYSEPAKAVGDAAGLGIVIGSFMDYLPSVATALSAIWFLLRIVESLQTIYLKHKETKNGKQS